MTGTEDFGRRLTRLMTEHGIALRQLARTAKCPVSSLQHWRSGVVPSDFDCIKRLASALGVSFSYLLIGENDASEPMFLEGVIEIQFKNLRLDSNENAQHLKSGEVINVHARAMQIRLGHRPRAGQLG